ncbi:T9SS type A sorting domain-containing protein [Chitinophagaceae bacterium MMS25-I14]
MKYIFTAAFLLLFTGLYAQQDTIRIMQYNLLNYGNSANPVAFKNPRLSTIVQFIHPDIFGANEIRNDSTLPGKLRDSVLGSNWDHAAYINTNNETQINMLFWNKARFGFRGQVSICQNLRDIIAYQLYYKDTFSQTHDTIAFTVIVAHLKASNTSPDAADRAAETALVRDYLDSLHHGGNYIFMGDLNLYKSSELAYQNLVSNPDMSARLYDPISRPGNWNGGAAFTDIHTQATRTAALSDGGVTGGLDDRFDHIMVSQYIMEDSAGMQYLAGSYHTAGQDGQHLNKALTDLPTNTAAPANVIQALYEMSDHLPVYASFAMKPFSRHTSVENIAVRALQIGVQNPVSHSLHLFVPAALNAREVYLQLYNTVGQRVMAQSVALSGAEMMLPLTDMPPGMYILQLQSGSNVQFNKLIVE